MKYDDATWHSGGDFPSHLSPDAAATHIGMFVAWLLLSGFANPAESIELAPLENRTVTPGQFLIEEMNMKFLDFCFNEEANRFVKSYYSAPFGGYDSDYDKIFGSEVESIYEVENSWANFDQLRPVLDARLATWRSKNR